MHFDVNKESSPSSAISRSPSQVVLGNYCESPRPTDGANDLPTLFTPSAEILTPTPTQPSILNDDGEDFFLHGTKRASEKSAPPARPPLVSRISSIAGNEPHSPVWGRTSYFNQPKSRAVSPPPKDILKPSRDESGFSRGSNLADIREDSREDSRERALQSADWLIQPAEQGNGGLRHAVNAAIQSSALEHCIWVSLTSSICIRRITHKSYDQVGTLGMPTDALGDERRADIAEKLENENDCLAVFPSDSDFDGHYSHFCKTILWPVFHYQIPDSPRSKAYQDHSWVYYVKVNELFADRIVKSWKRGDVVWIHDYHLLLVPSMVRAKLPEAQIGFFLHTAFPSSEVFRCLARRTKLLEGLLGANLVGFQTQEYCHHFLQTCNRLLCAEATPMGVQLEDRFVDVATFPIGVDPDALEDRRQEDDTKEWLRRIRAKYAGKQLIVARDKLDHIRGVRQKLLSYELFLNRYPEARENVVLIQVATSSIEPGDDDGAVSDIVTRINSSHSTLAHQPLVFLKQDIEYPQYLAMLMVADALMITSLREGMNLTAHEFVLCQDGKLDGSSKHSSLILSEFTGSASLFSGDEISVNPWDYKQCAEAIRRALTMSPRDKEAQWQRLLERVQHHTAAHWLAKFLARLETAHDQHSRTHTVSIPRLSIPELCANYQATSARGRRLLLLDHEGTLAPKGSSLAPGVPYSNPQRAIDVLCNLTADPRNVVYVMSACTPEELDKALRRVPHLGLVAENGCFVKEPDTLKWHAEADVQASRVWIESMREILGYYKDRIEGSRVEERHCSVAFHLPEAAPQAGECANHINEMGKSLNVHAVSFEGGMVIESTEVDKGTAARRILAKLTKGEEISETDKANDDALCNDKKGMNGHASSEMNGSANGSAHGIAVRDMINGAEGLTLGGGENVGVNGKDHPLDFLLVMGDSREDEVLYHWANKLGEDDTVRAVTTVSVSSRNTAAQATLTQGVTGKIPSGAPVPG